MTDKAQIQGSDRDPSGGAADSGTANATTKRRRLMLGMAAAVPSVYTLSSGATTSMISGTMCRVGNWRVHHMVGMRGPIESGAPSSEVPIVSVTEDDYLRAPVYVGSYDGLPAHCVMENQQYCMDPMDPTTAADGSVWIAGGERVVVNRAQKRVITQVSSSPQGYGLIFVNQEGTIATLNPQTAGLQQVTRQCWNSILQGRVFHDMG